MIKKDKKLREYFNKHVALDMQSSLSVDLYAENLKLQDHYSKQEDHQKVLGATIYNLWVVMADLEKKRMDMYKRVLVQFIEKHKEVNGNEDSLSACLSQLTSIDQEDEFHQAWDVETVLS